MQVISPDIEKSKILVHPEDILRLLGGQEGSVDAHASALAEQYIEVCSRIMTPLVGYVVVNSVEPESSEEIAIEGMHFQTGNIVHKMLKHSETYAFFLVTAGPEPESWPGTSWQMEITSKAISPTWWLRPWLTHWPTRYMSKYGRWQQTGI